MRRASVLLVSCVLIGCASTGEDGSLSAYGVSEAWSVSGPEGERYESGETVCRGLGGLIDALDGPVVLMTHSMAGAYGIATAAAWAGIEGAEDPEPDPGSSPCEPPGDAFELERSGSFATETMARLLEEQGDTARAESIRSRLGGSGDAATDAAEAPSGVAAVPAEDAERARVTAKLELWLANLRRPSL